MRRPNARRPCSVPDGPCCAPSSQDASKKARRLQLAAMQVALDAHVGVPRVLALQQLALGERGARARERPHRRERAGQRQLGERPREQQVADGDRHVASGRGPDRRLGRAAGRRRRGRRRARASRCARARPPTAARTRSAASSFGGPAARSTSSGRSRLPPAAIVAAGVFAEHVAVSARELREPLLDLREQLGHPRPGRLDDRADRCGRRGHERATVPTCRAMIPPAVRIHFTRSRPAPASTAASPSGPGKRRTEFGR